MRQQEFEQQYQSHWASFAKKLSQLEQGKQRHQLSDKACNAFPNEYRAICHSLAIAKERQYSPQLIEHLETLVLRGHQLFYKRRTQLLQQIVAFIAHGFSYRLQQHLSLFWTTHAIFYGPAIILFLLTLLNPDMIYSIMPPEQVNQLETMYDPEQTSIGRLRESDTDFLMFGHYIKNNIGIGFRTFATGILFTLGSLFFLMFNGVYFGAVSAHIVSIKYQSTFFSFVIGHGSFELTAILISGMAGILLGWSLIAPGNISRLDALKLASAKAIQLMYGAILFLVIAAFVEAFWSSSSNLTNTTKYIVGGSLWCLVYLYLLWPRKAVQS